MKRNKDRPVALVTGGTRGIGFGCAVQLVKAGFDIAVNGLREQRQVAGSLQRLKDLGADAVYCRGDVSLPRDRKGIIDKIKARFGGLHVLVNNAGMAPRARQDLLEMTEASYDEVLGVNLKGPLFLTQAVAAWMIAQKKSHPGYQGTIINISSISATTASINRSEYCISKAGMGMVTRLFADRLGPHGIPVYEIRPGIIKTDMTAGVTEKYDRLIADGLCITRRWGLPEDVGRAVAALASADFSYSTGQVIMVDGGMTIPRL